MIRNFNANPLFLFSHYKVFPQWNEERTSRYYIKLILKDSSRWFYESILFQERMHEFFFPNLVESSFKNRPCYLFVTLRHYSSQNDGYKFPAVWKIDHFLKNNDVTVFPASLKELDENHFPLARSFLEIYPGGAGMRVREA